MTVIEEPRQATTDVPGAEALIKEARSHQHKRWLLVGIIVLIVLVASTVWASSGGRSTGKPPASSRQPSQTKSTTSPGPTNRAAASGVALPKPLILGVSFPTPSRGFASAYYCTAVHCFMSVETTANGGVTWKQVANLARPLSPNEAPIGHANAETSNDLYFANARDGLLYANSSVVLVTSDGGKQWKPVQLAGVPVQALSLGQSFLLVIDGCGHRYEQACSSSELATIGFGGSAGTLRHLPPCLHNQDVTVTAGVLLAAGCHALYRSDDGGLIWEHQRLPFACPPSLLAADRPSDIWALCIGGPGMGTETKLIYRSHNAGATWTLVGSSTTGEPSLGHSIGKVPFAGYSFMLVATSTSHALLLLRPYGVAATFDGGRLWVTAHNAVVRYGYLPGAANCADSLDCWAGGGPYILRTTNGGRTWSALSFAKTRK